MANQNKTRGSEERKTEDPWIAPSEWYLYRCRSCDFVSWVEDIAFDAFPPHRPGGGPVLGCRECNGECFWDASVPTQFSYGEPPLPLAMT